LVTSWAVRFSLYLYFDFDSTVTLAPILYLSL
jgi:hypothetical protein